MTSTIGSRTSVYDSVGCHRRGSRNRNVAFLFEPKIAVKGAFFIVTKTNLLVRRPTAVAAQQCVFCTFRVHVERSGFCFSVHPLAVRFD